MKPLSVFLIVLACFLVVLYVLTYFMQPKNVSILQTSVQNFKFDMLREKQPIVIDDRVVSLNELAKLWFKPNIVTNFRLEHSDLWHKNKYKYVVLQAEQEGDIYMYPAGKKVVQGLPDTEETLLAVHLLPGQIVIVPYRWWYHVPDRMVVSSLGVHDYITNLMSL
jgi:hypothetical protein